MFQNDPDYDEMSHDEEVADRWSKMNNDERKNFGAYNTFRKQVKAERKHRMPNIIEKRKPLKMSREYLELAMKYDDYDLAKLALNKCPEEDLSEVMEVAFAHLKNLSNHRIFELLFNSGMENCEEIRSCAMNACINNNFDLLEVILNNCSKICMNVGDNGSLYRVAMSNDNFEMFKFLIDLTSIPDYEQEYIEKFVMIDDPKYEIYMRYGVDIEPKNRETREISTQT